MNYEVMTAELKPLDISPYCKGIFGKCSKTLVMSATILNHKAFCQSVGLSPDEVKFIQVQSDFPVEHRPIVPLNIAYLNYNNLQSAEVKYSIMSMHRNDKRIIHTTSYSQGHPNYTTINSNRTAELEGFPAYSLEFSDINTDDNSTYKDLELGTIIFGDKVLYVYYRADTPSFSTFLPTALEMIGSLRINESVITEPVPSSSPSRSIITSTAATPCSQVYYIWWEYSYRCWT